MLAEDPLHQSNLANVRFGCPRWAAALSSQAHMCTLASRHMYSMGVAAIDSSVHFHFLLDQGTPQRGGVNPLLFTFALAHGCKNVRTGRPVSSSRSAASWRLQVGVPADRCALSPVSAVYRPYSIRPSVYRPLQLHSEIDMGIWHMHIYGIAIGNR